LQTIYERFGTTLQCYCIIETSPYSFRLHVCFVSRHLVIGPGKID
jgi:hypothetical protein